MSLDTRNAGSRVAFLAIAAGGLLGFAYTLSPLTVLCLPVIGLLALRVGRDLGQRERQWFFALVIVAIVLRLSAIAGLFLWADDAQPYATFFGDEQLFKNRSMWMRNIGMGMPISPADIIYAVDDVGESSYLYVLAILQALVGAAPYGVHVLNTTFYAAAVLVLYRLVRPAFGGVASLAGLGLLLFLPSLFVWSISALKEPLYTLVAVGELWCALYVIRGKTWGRRVAAAAGLVVGAFALDSVRRGGLSVAVLGAAGGLVLGVAVARPRLLLAMAVTTPVIAALALSTPAVQERLLHLGRMSANYHIGHVVSLGYSYRLIEPRYYREIGGAVRMPPREVAAYAVKSVASYVVQPLPWKAESRAMLAYLPEQMLWLIVVALVPIGILAGLRRDPLLASLLAAHAGAVMMMVALTSGNIGTLIRHRGLALPYLAWLAGLGVCEFVRVMTAAPSPFSRSRSSHGHR